MATEEQTQYDAFFTDGSNVVRAGQRLTVSFRSITKLGFWLSVYPGGTDSDITFTIRKMSDKTILASKVWGNTSLIAARPTITYCEIEFDTAIAIDEEVLILAEWVGPFCYAEIHRKNTDVKADEWAVYYTNVGGWSINETGQDMGYIYTYGAGSFPTVTTQALTDIVTTAATGHGVIVNKGLFDITEHGHCWGTSIDPTTDNSKTTLGDGSLGAFTSSIAGLTAGTKYYVRAYATNAGGTGYGNNISFTAGSSWTQLKPYIIGIVQTRLHYVDADGKERYIEGTLV